jgi:predicted Zn-ribbon and HTH transcriptional regulator
MDSLREYADRKHEIVVNVRLEGHEQVERQIKRLIELAKELKSLGVSTGDQAVKPSKCGDCGYYSESQFTCHSEVGFQANCGKGYMAGHDMRCQSFRSKLFKGCKLGIDG